MLRRSLHKKKEVRKLRPLQPTMAGYNKAIQQLADRQCRILLIRLRFLVW